MLQFAGIGLLACAAISFGLVTAATATGPGDGTSVPSSAVPVGTFTAMTPFSSGQNINVVLPANSDFSNTTNLNIVECSAPGGVIPTDPTVCDGNTIQGVTLKSNADGSVNLQAETNNLYTVYALPDALSLGEGSSGPVCNLSTECILYIGYNQLDFTKPHFWSQPFFVGTNANDSDDGGENPGDGSPPPVPALPSATLSTVVASPATATGDGGDISTVTVTLLATGSIPVTGKAVSLTASTGTAKVTGPAPALTNASGQVTFSVTDSTPESITVTAADTTDNVTLTPPTTIDFQAPSVFDTHSTVMASPTTVPSGSSTTITVTLRDQGTEAQPVMGQTVNLAGVGSEVISPTTPQVTDGNGVVTFTATDTAAEKVTFKATVVSDNNLVLSSTAVVTFGTLIVDPVTSTVTATSPIEVGTKAEATITLLTTGGSPVGDKIVSLSSSGAATPGASATTDSNGQATIQVADSTPETVTLTAMDVTDGLTLSKTATIAFQTPAPSGSVSTMTPPTATSPADGQTQTLIKVTMTDQFGNGLANKAITLSASPTGNIQDHPIASGSSTPGVTDANGVADFEADDTVAEVVTLTATDTTDNIVIGQTAVLTFTAGLADADESTVVATPAQVPADGHTATLIAVTLNDLFDNPVAGKTITLTSEGGNSIVTPSSAVTGANGVATFTATDATSEFVTYDANDTTDTLPLSAQAVVTFGDPPSPPPVPAFSSVVATPTSVPADGSTLATIAIILYDQNGDAVVGKILSLTASGGSSTITAVNGTSDNTGNAMFTVSDKTAELVTYTVMDTTDNLALTADAAKVTFTASSGGTTTTTTTTATGSTTTTSAPGTTSTTTTAPGSTTTTSVPTSGSNSDGSTSDGSTSSGGNSANSLAFTGASAMIPWLVGFGLLFMVVGTVGRRRFTSSLQTGEGISAL